MEFTTVASIAIYALSIAIALACLPIVFQRRNEPGAVALLIFLLTVATAGLSHIGTTLAQTFDGKLAWFYIGFGAVLVLPAVWVYFALEYTGRTDWTGRKAVGILSIEPLLVAAVLVLPLPAIVWRDATIDESSPHGSIDVTWGLVAGLHYTYYLLLVLLGSLLLLSLALRSRTLYRGQVIALLVAGSIPWIGHFAMGLRLVPGLDMMPASFAIAGVSMTLALTRFRLLDPVPTARKTVVEDMADGVLVLDDRDRIGDANPAAGKLLGTAPETLRGDPVSTHLPTLELPTAASPSESAWQDVTVETGEKRRHLEVSVAQYYDQHDRPAGRLVTLRDVTERVERERRLARFQTVFESVHDRVFVLDDSNCFIMVNERFLQFVERDREQILGQPFETILEDSSAEVPDDRGEAEVTVRTGDGRQIPCEVTFSTVAFDDDWDSERRVVGTLRDISRRQAVEADLQVANRQLDTLVTASPLAIIAIDENGCVDTWNPAAEQTFGWSTTEILGEQLPANPVRESDEKTLADIKDRVFSGERITDVEISLRRKDGTEIVASVSAAPLYDATGEIDGAVSITADVTERKKRQRRLERKNEQLERFASVLSHDLRNPLNVAQGRLELARETGDDTHFEKTEDAHKRIEDIIEALLTLARKGRTVDEREVTTLRNVTVHAWNTVETEGAELVHPPNGILRADAARLQEAFENLFRNAIEHGGFEDTITVEVGLLEDETGFYVQDDGVGIAADERDIVFEYGFTTNDGGTGFGLAIVRDIIEAHDWEIAVVDAVDSTGTRFEIRSIDSLTIPATDAESAHRP